MPEESVKPTLTQTMNSMINEMLELVGDTKVCKASAYPLFKSRIVVLAGALGEYAKLAAEKIAEQDDMILQLALRPTLTIKMDVGTPESPELLN